MKTITTLIKQHSTLLIDVRTAWEYESGHLNGARNIPLDELPSKANELKELGQPLILYCQSGARSGMAVVLLQQQGLSEVFNGGGIGELVVLLNKTT